MALIRIRKGKLFGKGLSYAKKVGGRYNPADETWTLPETAEVGRMLNAPAAYGWTLMTATRGQPCPVCGTYCDNDCQASRT